MCMMIINQALKEWLINRKTIIKYKQIWSKAKSAYQEKTLKCKIEAMFYNHKLMSVTICDVNVTKYHSKFDTKYHSKFDFGTLVMSLCFSPTSIRSTLYLQKIGI